MEATHAISWDLHVHAGPSSAPRWGTDLDLVEAAHRHGVRGFVLKSHHESTAGRAVIANAFGARIGSPVRVVGSIVLNPWVTFTEMDRALKLGAKVVFWPTRGARGRSRDLRLPRFHRRFLERAAAANCVVATGHLALDEAAQLVADGARLSLPVIATHPFNPDVGVGLEGARRLAELGAVVEVDAYSLHLRPDDVPAIADAIEGLLASGARVVLTSDGGQAATGDPFVFATRALRSLHDAGLAATAPLVETATQLIGFSVG
jgi:hypothetical protein